MILFESKNLLPPLFLSLTFWSRGEFDLIQYRKLPGDLVLARQLETLPDRDSSWVVRSWMSTEQLGQFTDAPDDSFSKRLS